MQRLILLSLILLSADCARALDLARPEPLPDNSTTAASAGTTLSGKTRIIRALLSEAFRKTPQEHKHLRLKIMLGGINRNRKEIRRLFCSCARSEDIRLNSQTRKKMLTACTWLCDNNDVQELISELTGVIKENDLTLRDTALQNLAHIIEHNGLGSTNEEAVFSALRKMHGYYNLEKDLFAVYAALVRHCPGKVVKELFSVLSDGPYHEQETATNAFIFLQNSGALDTATTTNILLELTDRMSIPGHSIWIEKILIDILNSPDAQFEPDINLHPVDIGCLYGRKGLESHDNKNITMINMARISQKLISGDDSCDAMLNFPKESRLHIVEILGLLLNKERHKQTAHSSQKYRLLRLLKHIAETDTDEEVSRAADSALISPTSTLGDFKLQL